MKIRLKKVIQSIFSKAEKNQNYIPRRILNYQEMDVSNTVKFSINLPWVESPFFQSLIAEKTLLTEKQKQQATNYHNDGYIIFRQLIDDKTIKTLRQELENKAFNPKFPIKTQRDERRIQDFITHSKSTKKIATNKTIIDTIEMFYERKPIVFQSLHFKQGSNQKAHSDILHFDSLPHNYMCGAWVALEDITMENGPVFYYPKSHQLPQYYYTDILPYLKESPSNEEYEFYEQFIEQLMREKGIEKKYFTAQKGDVLIWSANLIHGGQKIQNSNSTRYSQVTHYLFEDCIYHRPIKAELLSGKKHILNGIKDLVTGEKFSSNFLTNQQYTDKQITKREKELNIEVKNFKYLDKTRNLNFFSEGLIKTPIITFDFYNWKNQTIKINCKTTILEPTTKRIILTAEEKSHTILRSRGKKIKNTFPTVMVSKGHYLIYFEIEIQYLEKIEPKHLIKVEGTKHTTNKNKLIFEQQLVI